MIDALIVCSPGGHFSEAKSIICLLDKFSFKYVVHDLKVKPSNLDNIIIAPHFDRDLRFFMQLFFAYKCISKFKPKFILSTGSSIAVTFFLVAKFYKIPTIYVESPTRVFTPSLTAKLIKHLTTRMYVRHKELLAKLPHAIYLEE